MPIGANVGSGTNGKTFKLYSAPVAKKLELPLEFHLISFPTGGR